MIIGLGISISSPPVGGSGPTITNGLQIEAGDFLLMEDGSNILLD
jgi:hypothetical protein